MPVTLETTVTTDEGVTFVTLHVRNTEPVDRQVRLENRLDGPVLPPRRHGRPERGWSDEGFVGVVAAESTLALGYACRDESPPLEEQAVKLVSVSDPADRDGDPVDHALATLGDARPPADAVPTGGDGGDDAAVSDRPTNPASDRSTDLPPPVVRYLDEVETRLDRADALASGSVVEVTETLESGVDPRGLDRVLAADATALSRLADRVTALTEQAETTTVPTEALERLA